MNIYINMHQLKKLVTDAEKNPLYDEIYNLAKDNYILGLGNERPENIYETASRINERQNDKGQRNSKKMERGNSKCQFWAFGQLKIFSWVSIYYCYSKSIQLSKMCENDFKYVQSIFIQKKLMFIKYQTYCLAYSKNKIKDQWTDQQQHFLTDIIRRMQMKNDWRYISFSLFSMSQGKFFRSLQQCREKWANYLNPIVKKGDWELEEDIKLFNLIGIYKCKWATISRQFNGIRTEHMVKNRYNAYIKSWKNKNNKKASPEQIESKIFAFLKKKASKRQHNKLMSEQAALLKNEEPINQSLEEQMSQYNFSFPKESQGVQQDSIFHLNQMMERVEVQKLEKEEKKTREDENEDIQIKAQTDKMDYELFSESYTDKLKRENEIFPEESKSYINFIEVSNSSDLFGMQQMNELVSALGCCHYERIADNDWLLNELEERRNLDWIQ